MFIPKQDRAVLSSCSRRIHLPVGFFDYAGIPPDGGIRPIEAMQIIGGALYKEQKKPVDLLVSRASDFQQRKLLPTIERTVARDGVRLYG